MATKKLSDFVVRNLKAPGVGRLELWDTVVPGFGIRVTDKGAKSWFVMYRIGSGDDRRQRRYSLGNASVISLADARESARLALQKVERGIDPAEEPDTAAPAAGADQTLKKTAEAYLSRYLEKHARPATYAEAKRTFEVDVFPTLGGRQISDIKRRDITTLIDGISDRGAQIHANRTLARLRSFFNWCIGEEYLTGSPVALMKPVAKEVARDRVLDENELRWFWAACDDLGQPFGPLFKLLLLTAQRRDEVGTIERPEFDLEKRLWTIPKEKTKNGRAHEVPLSQAAVVVLESCPEFKIEDDAGNERIAPFVFTTNGKTPVSGFSKVKERLDKKMNELRRKELELAEDEPEMPPFILHDLRRTATTGMAKLNIAPHVVDRILNHVTGAISGVAAVYNRHGYIEERKTALEAWGRYVTALVEGKPANVRQLRA